MTAQVAEKLRYQGDDVAMYSCPLEDYFRLNGARPRFQDNGTALWRGYVGNWEVVANRLYLVGLDGALADGTPVALDTLFPGFAERVFAHWFSGEIRLPQGKRLRYTHMGFDSMHERDLFLRLERGVVVATRTQENSVADSDRASDDRNAGIPAGPPNGHGSDRGGV